MSRYRLLRQLTATGTIAANGLRYLTSAPSLAEPVTATKDA
jgi:hypothetical protein